MPILLDKVHERIRLRAVALYSSNASMGSGFWIASLRRSRRRLLDLRVRRCVVAVMDRNRMKQEHFHRSTISTYVTRSSWHLMAFHVRDRLTSCAEALQVFARKDSSAIFEGCSLCIIRCLANFPYLLAGRFELHLWTSCSFFFRDSTESLRGS